MSDDTATFSYPPERLLRQLTAEVRAGQHDAALGASYEQTLEALLRQVVQPVPRFVTDRSGGQFRTMANASVRREDAAPFIDDLVLAPDWDLDQPGQSSDRLLVPTVRFAVPFTGDGRLLREALRGWHDSVYQVRVEGDVLLFDIITARRGRTGIEAAYDEALRHFVAAIDQWARLVNQFAHDARDRLSFELDQRALALGQQPMPYRGEP